ncbi:MAG: hypothetical protein ABH839_01715 [Chloroflexota bacterium]
MPKLRIIYIIALGVLAVLVVFTVFRPMVSKGKYSEVQREQLLETDDEWIIQFVIINREGEINKYIINTLVGGTQSTESVSLDDGQSFTYIRHIRRDRAGDGNVSFTIYKENEETPIKRVSYHLQ